MSAKFSILDKTAPLRGVFSMRVIDRSGKVIREYSDHNMIVNTAREALARLVSEGDQSKRITRFRRRRQRRNAYPCGYRHHGHVPQRHRGA